MKRLFLLSSLFAVLLILSSCYWSPTAGSGSLTFKLQTKGLEGYKARVTFHSVDDIDLKWALKIGGKKHFDLDVTNTYSQASSAFIFIDEIPADIQYRVKLQLGLWDYDKDDWLGTDYYTGNSELFTVIQGETVPVNVKLFPDSPDDDDDDDKM